MGRRPKNRLTDRPSEQTESFNLANSLTQLAIVVSQSDHIKESTIQAAGFREISPSTFNRGGNDDE